MTVLPTGLSLPAPDAITLDDIIAMYEALRPQMPPAVPPAMPTREVSDNCAWLWQRILGPWPASRNALLGDSALPPCLSRQ